MKVTQNSLFVLLLFLISCNQLSYEYSGYNVGNIEIARDDYGVPHIFGKSDPDVAYGLAWAHAEDDFETIQQTLLAGKAMVGRVFGKEGAAVDYFVHLLETREIADAKYKTDYSEDFQKLLDAYMSGINDFALSHPERVLYKRLSLSLKLISFQHIFYLLLKCQALMKPLKKSWRAALTKLKSKILLPDPMP